MPLMKLQHRLRLLTDAQLIDHEILQHTIQLIRKVETEFSLTLTEDNGGPFIGHCALALQRLKNGVPITEKSDNVDTFVETYPNMYAFALELLKPFSLYIDDQSGVEIEAGLILLYLLTLTESD